MANHTDVSAFADDWDAQIDRDSASGKLDFLFEEAEREAAQGLVREWPPKPGSQIVRP